MTTGKEQTDTDINPDESAYVLDRKDVASIVDAVDAGDHKTLTELMEPLQAADIADLLEQVTSVEREAWLTHWSKGIDGEVLSELEEGLRDEVLTLPHPRIAERAFVLVPLADIAPDLAIDGRRVAGLLADLDAGPITPATADGNWWRS